MIWGKFENERRKMKFREWWRKRGGGGRRRVRGAEGGGSSRFERDKQKHNNEMGGMCKKWKNVWGSNEGEIQAFLVIMRMLNWERERERTICQTH